MSLLRLTDLVFSLQPVEEKENQEAACFSSLINCYLAAETLLELNQDYLTLHGRRGEPSSYPRSCEMSWRVGDELVGVCVGVRGRGGP